MRLNCGEGNGVLLAGRTSQNTARIAHNGAFCRTFTLFPPPAVGAVGILTRIYLPQTNHVLVRTINTQF
jgi:hypothetical protein